MVAAVNTCRSCGAPIIWAISESSGRRMPIDAQPVEGGTILLQHILAGEPSMAHITKPEERVALAAQAATRGEPLRLFVSHHATCPQADDWRRK